MDSKPKVFVITPFGEDFLALYNELKEKFSENFEFTNAKDLDNQQNILKDIVKGIYEASVVIADLTGLNANVFYELGLAHAMNKKVIIITQNIAELPFDIKSYRANEYSMQFNKLTKLIEELNKLLFGAINNNLQYGNPVSDYIPNFYQTENSTFKKYDNKTEEVCENKELIEEDDDEKGFFDYISDIDENSEKMTAEIEKMGTGIDKMNISIGEATNEINRVKSQRGNVDASFLRNVCGKLSNPITSYAEELKENVKEISRCWGIIENSYLSLLDNKYALEGENIRSLWESINSLRDMQNSMNKTDTSIEGFIGVLNDNIGMERRLSKAITLLINEFEAYLTMTSTMSSSIDRIQGKADIVINANIQK